MRAVMNTYTYVLKPMAAACSAALLPLQMSTYAQANTPETIDVADDAKAVASTQRWCRSGAFIDALKLMNSIMSVRDSLRKETAAHAVSELGSMLSTAIKQASDEYPCVEDTLTGGYDSMYATTVKRAAVVAQAMRLPPDVVGMARALAEKIQASGAPK
jgi:hypothetical protein